jgi:type IV pilus assembly protein PilM
MSTNTYFYHDKPLFGLDIGYSSAKVMQISLPPKQQIVQGYGVSTFPSEHIVDGTIVDVEAMAKVIKGLFEKQLIGEVTTRRVALSVPAARTYNRPITLPKLAAKDIAEAVRLEAEQYIPVPLDNLYIDYSITFRTDTEIGLLAVAAPKIMVDSYVQLSRLLGLELVALETTIGASSRLFVQAEHSDSPTVLIDFGSMAADITVYDHGLIVTGAVPCGGDIFTSIIARELKVTKQEAHVIKTKYGLGISKKQAQITAALDTTLNDLLKEIRRVIRYYEERSGADTKISQIVTMGGGANMPGLSEFMTNALRLPVRMCDPWQNLDFAGLQPPSPQEKSMYVTVAGLGLINPREIFA